jgi:hypothetical protein
MAQREGLDWDAQLIQAPEPAWRWREVVVASAVFVVFLVLLVLLALLLVPSAGAAGGCGGG